jgi:hypothetical protein
MGRCGDEACEGYGCRCGGSDVFVHGIGSFLSTITLAAPTTATSRQPSG